jgi:hypothetical protein
MNEIANQMLPCYSHFIILIEYGTFKISTYSVGADWSIMHIDDRVNVRFRDGRKITLHISNYKK